MKIGLITVYFGTLPWYFSYFLYTAKFNPDVDFILYTDNNCADFLIPSNVKLISFSIEDFNITATKKLKIPIKVTSSYKLCDFKPAYGTIFQEELSNYDFWGYCDIDIIWGDIRCFITDKLLERYDVISARHDYLTGCFSLFRNVEKFRTLYMESKDYLKVFSTDTHFCFDETNFAFEEFDQGKHYSEISSPIESMTHVILRLYEEKVLKAYFEFQILEGLAGNMLWDNGKIIYRKEFECMFYHLVRFKKIYSETIDPRKHFVRNRIRIGKKKIY
ncbi:MAG: hypothetical protein K0S24_3746 [Sphingobacterium sp.]|jgi:hypothetical protein|nr:hypothetical protein [Sphingobacterium sp.]